MLSSKQSWTVRWSSWSIHACQTPQVSPLPGSVFKIVRMNLGKSSRERGAVELERCDMRQCYPAQLAVDLPGRHLWSTALRVALPSVTAFCLEHEYDASCECVAGVVTHKGERCTSPATMPDNTARLQVLKNAFGEEGKHLDGVLNDLAKVAYDAYRVKVRQAQRVRVHELIASLLQVEQSRPVYAKRSEIVKKIPGVRLDAKLLVLTQADGIVCSSGSMP